jgi:FlaG/FlaF family flagellin (archaellin)
MDRAVAPVVGVTLLLAVTVLAASAVGTAALALDIPDEPTRVTVSLDVDAATGQVRVTHRGGQTLDVTRLSLTVTVDGEAIDEQPPVPFFAASGFRSGPTGPFNSAADPNWSAAETAGFSVASTNSPTPDAGDRVTIRIAREDQTVVTTQTRAS